MNIQDCLNRCCALLRTLQTAAHFESFYHYFFKPKKNPIELEKKDLNEIGYTIELTDSDGQLTGQKLTCTGGNIRPLKYADLLVQIAGLPGKLPIAWDNAKVLESDHANARPGDRTSFTTYLNSNFSCNTFCLVENGWLPLGLAVPTDIILLLDNCTTTRLNPSSNTKRIHPDFIDFLRDRPIRINPSLYAIEGNQKATLSNTQIEERLREAYDKIARQLPKAILIPKDMAGLEGVKGIIKESNVNFSKKQHFLVKVAPKLNGEVTNDRKGAVWSEILDLAAQHKVPTDSLLMVLLLTMVSVQKNSPGYKIIKPGQQYTMENAYNALSDLRALEIYMTTLGYFPNEKVAFCTNDKNLALFWVGIQPNGFVSEGNHCRYKLNPVPELLNDTDIPLFRSLFE